MQQKIIVSNIPGFKTSYDIKCILDDLISKGYYIQSSIVINGDLISIVNETVNIKTALSTLRNKRSR